MLNVITLSVIMLSIVVLNVIMLTVVILNIIMLSVVAPYNIASSTAMMSVELYLLLH